jgi:hypothetical protein
MRDCGAVPERRRTDELAAPQRAEDRRGVEPMPPRGGVRGHFEDLAPAVEFCVDDDFIGHQPQVDLLRCERSNVRRIFAAVISSR